MYQMRNTPLLKRICEDSFSFIVVVGGCLYFQFPIQEQAEVNLLLDGPNIAMCTPTVISKIVTTRPILQNNL